MGPWAAEALSLIKLIPEQILTRQGRIFNLWPHSRGLQPRCGLQRRRERHRFTGRECLYPSRSSPVVTCLSCFHGPVYRCYERALGAGAAPSRFYRAPRRLCRVVALPLFVQRNKLSLPKFTGGHSSSELEEYVRMPLPLLQRHHIYQIKKLLFWRQPELKKRV